MDDNITFGETRRGIKCAVGPVSHCPKFEN